MANLRKRYSKNLVGVNAQGAVSTTHAAVKPAVEGNTTFEQTTPAGVVTYVDGTALVAANDYRMLQFQDGEIRSTIKFKGSDILSVTNVNYDAPVIQRDSIAINDAAASAVLATPGLKEFTIASRDTTPSNQPFPVTEARAVIRNTTTTKIELIQELINQFNNVLDYENNADEQFSYAIVEGSVSGGPATATVTAVGKAGSNLIGVVGLVAVPEGSLVVQGGLVYTAANTAAVGENLYVTQKLAADAVAVAAGGVGDTLATATGISIVGNTFDTHFSTIVGEDMADISTVTTAAPWKQGTGDYLSIAAMEEEFAVFSGATTINAQWKEDYGDPTRFAIPSETYGLSIIKYKKATPSMAFANEQAHHVGYIMLAVEGGTAVPIAVA